MPAAPKKKALGTILLSHGAFKNREQVLNRAEFLVGMGYQVILFDQRGCGLSSESPLSGGILESKDYSAAFQYLEGIHKATKPVVFFGFSMGAMSALRAATADTHPDAVIADSPLANLKSYISRRTMGGSFSALPGFLNRCLATYDQLTGLSIKEEDMDLIPVVRRMNEVPVLYITGWGDDLAHADEVRKLYEQTYSVHRRYLCISEAGHEETFTKFPEIYERYVRDFLTDLRNGFPKPEDDESMKVVQKKATRRIQ